MQMYSECLQNNMSVLIYIDTILPRFVVFGVNFVKMMRLLCVGGIKY